MRLIILGSKKWFMPVFCIGLVAALCSFQAKGELPSGSYADKVNQTRYFVPPPVWLGDNPPSEQESRELWEALGEGGPTPREQIATELEGFVKAHPKSPWRATIEDRLGTYYRETGYYSLALKHWEEGWNMSKGLKDPKAVVEADKGLLRWLELLASLGRTDTMKELFDETKNRPMPGNLHNALSRLEFAYRHMMVHPQDSYRCGTFALNAVSHALTGTNHIRDIVQLESPTSGFSMEMLVEIAESNRLGLVAVERPSGDELVVPSVVHLKENHYAAIVEQRGNRFRIVDPTFVENRWLSREAINHEASGQFLVPSKRKPAGWSDLTAAECRAVFGKGWPADGWELFTGPPCSIGVYCPPGSGGNGSGNGGDGDGGGDNGGGGGSCGQKDGGLDSGLPGPQTPQPQTQCSSCTGGMPKWQVTEPEETLWIIDEPLAYQTATGRRMSFRIYRNNTPVGLSEYEYEGLFPQGYSFTDTAWRASWMSFMLPDGEFAYLYPPGGGAIQDYTNFDGTATEYNSHTRLIGITNSGSLAGYNVLHPNGAKDVYSTANGTIFMLTQQLDPAGRATSYVYDPSSGVLLKVIDCDGRTNTFSYGYNPQYGTSYLLTNITDPYGLSVSFTYCTNAGTGNSLSNVVDAQGIKTTFGYQDNSCETITNMTTPYGTTTFASGYQNSLVVADLDYYYCHVTEPDASQELFVFVGGEGCTLVPQVYTDTSNVPTNRPADNGNTNTIDNPDWDNPSGNDNMNLGNSFYWNRAQYANLSTAFQNSYATNGGIWYFDDLTATDLGNGRLRHWNEDGGTLQAFSLSMERLPSPDSVTTGKMTWWDYPGKAFYDWQGTNAYPNLEIRVQPDGSTWYRLYNMDQWGNRTNIISTYSSNGVQLLRTNTYVYSTNAVDLLKVIRPDGVTDMAYGYNTNHQVILMTNAVSDVTTNTYNTNMQLTSTAGASGLVITNIYDGNNRLSMTYSYAGNVFFGTNTYTYTNDLTYTHTDPRGMTTTNTWDNLERLTKVAYPDGTSVTYVYNNLDLVDVLDRLGHTNSFTYDAIERVTSMMDVNGHKTSYAYCECGGLSFITNALNQVTQYVYDYQGNLTGEYYPDGYDVVNTFNSIRQLVVRSDRVSVTNLFNNQGRLTAVNNAAGQVLSRTYDIDDRVITSVDKNGETIAMTYDNLFRILSRSYPDGGVEHFGYSALGLMAYTNQLTNRTYYGYDAMQRKVAETNAMLSVSRYAYNCASDLTNLTDPNLNTTAWGYDAYGRVTSKVDATGTTILTYQYDAGNRLTNRSSLAKGNTGYVYDNVGNLTSVTYPVSHALSFTYDVLNRLSHMTDGVGTTILTYTPGGQMGSETGPWGSDKLAFTYTNRMRILLDLQQANTSDWLQSYVYDGANRLNSVSSPAGTFEYSYNPGLGGTTSSSALIQKLALPNGAFITNTYDSNARMLGTWLTNNVTNFDSSVYTYNVGNQRTSLTRAGSNLSGSNQVNYGHDSIGEVVSDRASEVGSGANRYNEQLGYAFDGAGNLKYRTNNTLAANFQINSVNELTANTNGGKLTVMGTMTSQNSDTVTVNATSGQVYGDATFAVTNLSLTTSYTAIASDSLGRHATNSVTVNLSTNIAYQYDGNGNLTNDGLRNFVYDDENELIQVSASNAWMSQFSYDGMMRRRIRKEYTWQGGAWLLTNQVLYVYDGSLVIQERDANNLSTASYTRGTDLSGSFQDAGGIGGLLALTSKAGAAASLGNQSYYHSDANGNITMLVASNQIVVAKYVYDAFGNLLAKSGLFSDANLYRFSSKEVNPNSGLVYYLYRYYDPNLQRCPNRDPINERGGVNLYQISGNDLIDHTDGFGLQYGPGYPMPPAYPWPPPSPQYPSGFSMCQRDIQPDGPCDCPTSAANCCGGEHTYLQNVTPPPQGASGPPKLWGWGWGGGPKTGSEQHFHPSSCNSCSRSGSPLQYGSGTGTTGQNATDAQIQECIQKYPPAKPYNPLGYNCKSWAKGAAAACGLNCN